MPDDRFVVWRASVAAGDDVDAPHEWVLDAPGPADLRLLIERARIGRHLALIVGGRASWILWGDRPLAVVAQQWSEPDYLVPPTTPLSRLARPDGPPHFEFDYWQQVDPDLIRDCLRSGRPLPDLFGRRRP